MLNTLPEPLHSKTRVWARMLILLVAGCLTLVPVAMTCASPWQSELALGRDGYWSARLPVQVSNSSKRDAQGAVVTLQVNAESGMAALVGAAAEAVRVCDDSGVEMLYAIDTSDGRTVQRGAIPLGATISIPAECPAGGTVRYWIYFDNPAAWCVPDVLESRAGIINGSLELGSDGEPAGWKRDEGDAAHQTAWVRESAVSGERCLRTEVMAGAEPTWIGTRQHGVQVIGGTRYRLTAWVKARDVEGFCGWFIHVGDATRSQMLNQTLNAGAGSFDWKQVSAEFTAPDKANRLTVGTVLRGTGTAWYDNVSLVPLDGPELNAVCGAVEHLEVAKLNDDDPWRSEAADAVCRVPLYALNLTEQPVSGELHQARLDGLFTRLRGLVDPAATQVWCGDRLVPHRLWNDSLLYETDLPARSRQTSWVYVFTRGDTSVSTIDPTERGNRLFNPGFELGDALPDHWTTNDQDENREPVKFERVRAGRNGDWCVRTIVPAGTQPNWYGWHQNAAVAPGRSYLYAAWVRCEDIEGADVRLHGHCYRADGRMCEAGGFSSVGSGLSGTSDWTLVAGVVRMPLDAAEYRLHLTFNGTGTVWYDDVILQPVRAAIAGTMQHAASRVPSGLVTWEVNPIVKVFREDVPADLSIIDRPVAVTAAGRESEPVQLVVRSDVNVSDLSVEIDAPVHGTQTLDQMEVAVVGYVPVDYATSYYRSETPAWHRKVPTSAPQCDGWSGWWPDPLLPQNHFDLLAGQTQPLWITVHVPADVDSGEYRGTIRLVHGDQTVKSVPLNVQVRGFTLPEATHVKAIYDVRFHTAWYPGDGGNDRATAELWPFLARRRLSAHDVMPPPTFQYQDGVATADFTDFDAAARRYFDDLGMTHAYTPWHFYGFGWGHPLRTLFGEAPFEGKYPYEQADHSVLRPEWKQAYQACLRLFWTRVQQRGWADRFTLYISDEPHYDRHAYVVQQMQALCDAIHEVDRSIPIYSSTWGHLAEWDGYLDVWGIGHYGIVPARGMEQIRDTGAKIWFTTDGQMCLDTPYASTERLLSWFCHKYDAEAYEFWGVSWHTYDPYEYGWHAYIQQADQPGNNYYVRYPNGDGYLVYPPADDQSGPVSSIRLEQARDGVEDFEYFRLLEQLMERSTDVGIDAAIGRAAMERAMALIQIPNAGGRYSSRCVDDPDAILAARTAVAEAIEMLTTALESR